MNWILSVLLSIVIATLFVSNAVAQAPVDTRRAQLNAVLQEEWEYRLRTNPELASHTGDNRYNDKVSDFSPEFFAADLQHDQQMLARIDAIDTTGFPDQEKLNKVLMLRGLREQIESTQFKEWEMPVTQFGGPHMEYVSLASNTSFHSVKDYEDYLSRLHQLPHLFDQVTMDMRLGLSDHLMPPRYLLDKVVAEAHRISDDSPGASPFSQPVHKFPESISEADQKRLRAAVFAAVKNEVSPTYGKFAAFVRTEYAPRGRTDLGVWALPEGDARYQFAVRTMTTTNLSPEEIHQLGLKQVTEIESQMLKIARQQGFDDLKRFNEHIRKNVHLHATSGQQLLDLYQHYADQMYGKLPQLFGKLPKNKL